MTKPRSGPDRPDADRPSPDSPGGPSLVGRLSLNHPEDLLRAIPYLAGFRPKDSVVVLALRGRSVSFHCRVDLDPLLTGAFPPEILVGPIRRAGADQVLAVVFADPAEVTYWDGEPPGLRQVLDDLAEEGVVCRDSILVHDEAGRQRWWSWTCLNSECCPPAGQLVDPGPSVVDAALVAAGLVVYGTREDIEAEFADLAEVAGAAEFVAALGCAEALAPEGVVPLVTEWAERSDRGDTSGQRGRPGLPGQPGQPGQPDQRDQYGQWAALLLAVDEVRGRDEALRLLLAEPHVRTRAYEVWRQLLRLAPRHLRAAPATLCAAFAYTSGDGLRAGIAIERALEANPDYVLAQLIDTALRNGFAPEEVRSALTQWCEPPTPKSA